MVLGWHRISKNEIHGVCNGRGKQFLWPLRYLFISVFGYNISNRSPVPISQQVFGLCKKDFEEINSSYI